MEKAEIDQISASCTRFLSLHGRKTPRQALAELAECTDPAAQMDMYGSGELIEGFEQEVAGLLGKEAAVFMPSGTMCQQIALRLWSERRGSPHLAFHPKCHLEIHEQKGYQLLHGLHGVLLGQPERLFTLDDLRQAPERLAALLIELPQREIGGQLPPLDELLELTAWARERGIPLHLDGARLWECRPYYGQDYDQIASLFDSIYVSFYKGLGGIAGAILAGPPDLIQEARLWQRRHGGNLIRVYPYILSARQGLTERLPRMQAYHEKALEVAEILAGFPQADVLPDPPHTNMMHIYLRGKRQKLEQAALEVARASRIWLFSSLTPTPLPQVSVFELSVGDATLQLSRGEIEALFQDLFRLAHKV